MNLLPQEHAVISTKRLFYLLVLFAVVFTTACAVVPDIVRQEVIFNEDLSGRFTGRMAFTEYSYLTMQDYYGSDPTPQVAAKWAEAWKLTQYEYDHFIANGYHWVIITTEFRNPAEYESFITWVDIDLPDEEFPASQTVDMDNLFRTLYVHEGTWVSGFASGIDGTWSNVRRFYSIQLPGEIVPPTNGAIQNDGRTVVWNLSYYEHTPYRVHSEVRRISKLQLQHTITVNKKLSGDYTLALGFLPDEYKGLETYYDTKNVDQAVAAEMSERFDWKDVDYSTRKQDGLTWLELTIPFADPLALQTIYNAMATDAGTKPEISLTRDGSNYTLNTVPVRLFSQDVKNVEAKFTVKMPGKILSTNGQSENEATSSWDASAKTITVEAKTSNLGWILMMLGCLSGLVGLSWFGIKMFLRVNNPVVDKSPNI